MMRRPVLIVVDGPVVIQSLPLEKDSYLIGRATDCDLILPSPGVSRHHARLRKEGEGYYLEDLDSTNGTRVNGGEIKCARLKPGDEIEICDYKLVFDLKKPPPSKTRLEVAGEETSKLEVIYQNLRDRIEGIDVRKEFERYHRMVKKSRRRLSDRVNLDSLTGVYNRGFFEQKIARLIQDGQMFSLLLIDIDHFKKVNDRFGHQKGDEVLKAIAFLLKNSCRDSDIISRYGGEEFAIIFPDVEAQTAVVVAEEIRRTIKNQSGEITGVEVTISAGVAGYPDHGATKEAVIGAADRALYLSKERGRDQTTLYEV
ncbi:hypothetical protein DRP53_04015 [candidate division WOR-3 bacterium]|uniref:GGDEF domain-containing protein n=1 Tax=candidate division WOR-3 bacterium TaxID=2052148 RepID=A0A660SIV9_UNCW3|nr:MAG: hypothetical protein DRP53_04015 [candidate division WOR-3 bacterium]